jgi:hypothetical protein
MRMGGTWAWRAFSASWFAMAVGDKVKTSQNPHATGSRLKSAWALVQVQLHRIG